MARAGLVLGAFFPSSCFFCSKSAFFFGQNVLFGSFGLSTKEPYAIMFHVLLALV